jgi:hypothetical protein
MRSVKVALVAGLALLTVAIGLTLLGSPLSVAGSNRPPGQPEEPLDTTTSPSNSYCQSHELLPRGTSAIRIWLEAAAGPRVSVAVYSGGRLVTAGRRGSDWIGGSVTVPVRQLAHAVSNATVCVAFALHDETVVVQGSTSPQRMWIEYMRPGTRSWASLAGEVVRHMGLGRSPGGDWIVFLALALLVAIAALVSRVLVRELP